MSIILKGIDLPKMGENKRIVLYDNGDIVVDEDGWDEDGNRFYKTSYDVQAIQIPKDHGDIKDVGKLEDELDSRCGQLSAEIVRNAPTILDSET